MIYNIFEEVIKDCPTRTYKRNEFIYHEGDIPKGIYFVEDGLIGLFHISKSGKETFLRVFTKKSIFGHRSFFASESYHATAIALTNSQVRALPLEKCESFLKENPSKLRDLITTISKDLGSAEVRLAGLQDKSTYQRIAESLVFLKFKYPEMIWTRKEIGEYSCSSHESVARFMSEYEKLGIIEKIGRDFKILNKEKLLGLDHKN